MYFSDHNEKITFSNEWGCILKVEGKGLVCAEDLNASPGRFKPEEYSELEFTKGITKVTKGFIEAFTSLECLVIAFSVKSIERTPELDNFLITNNVLIRGEYNSLAERLAKELGLRFLHCDIFLGWTVLPISTGRYLPREYQPETTEGPISGRISPRISMWDATLKVSRTTCLSNARKRL